MILIFYASLFQGSIFYISEILFVFWFIIAICRNEIKIINYHFLLLIFIICLILLMNMEMDVISILFLLVFSFFISTKPLEITEKFLKNYKVFTLFYCITAIILFIDTLLFGVPVTADLVCMYGERARDYQSCAIQTYYVMGFPFPRMYGVAAEPAVLARLMILFFLFERVTGIAVSKSVQQLRALTFLLTFSVSAFFLAFLIYIILMLKKPLKLMNYFSNVRIWIAPVLMVVIAGIIFPEVIDIIYTRTVVRVSEVFTGADLSAFMRTTATYQPLFDKISNVEKWFTAPGIEGALEYLDSLKYMTYMDGNAVTVTGQVTNSWVFMFLSFGALSMIFYIVLLKPGMMAETLSMIVILCFTSMMLSLSYIAMLLIAKMRSRK